MNIKVGDEIIFKHVNKCREGERAFNNGWLTIGKTYRVLSSYDPYVTIELDNGNGHWCILPEAFELPIVKIKRNRNLPEWF